jgi:hypothetical protein
MLGERARRQQLALEDLALDLFVGMLIEAALPGRCCGGLLGA